MPKYLMRWSQIKESTDDISVIVKSLHDHIMWKGEVNHHQIATVLRAHGYKEPIWGHKFFRAHYYRPNQLSGSDIATYSDAYQFIRQNPQFEAGGPRSACDSLPRAMDVIDGLISMIHHNKPTLEMDTPIEEVYHVWAIYELKTSSQPLWSMRGLTEWVSRNGLDPELKKLIQQCLDEYGYQDEIMLDTSDVKVIDVHPFYTD